MDQKYIKLYDEYMHGALDRRDFLKRLAKLTGSVAAAYALLPLLENNYALADTVPANDPRITAAQVTYPGVTGDVKAYWAIPAGEGKYPGVLVIHENRGLNPHIEDVARRVAVEEYAALAPDALSPVGGTPADRDEARDMIGKLDKDLTRKDFVAAVKYLKTHPRTTGKVGVVGFCWGGAMTNQMAVLSEDVDAAVPYYGSQPAVEDVPKIKASLMLHYAGQDERINKGIDAFEAALKKSGVKYQKFIYEGANHAFNNDTNASRYHPEAARLAWKRTMDYFNETLKE
ncbi:MAG: dienelactone hydrolase family protein [Desulfobacteraceae bacterium]|nr:dienelactone hydrolase family protein [Desulfobacteraceae bacterium]